MFHGFVHVHNVVLYVGGLRDTSMEMDGSRRGCVGVALVICISIWRS